MATESAASASVASALPTADAHEDSEEEEDEEDDLEVDTDAINHASWQTATFENSFGSRGSSGANGWPTGMPPGMDYSAMGGFMPPMPGMPPMMPGMQFGIPMPPWGAMPPPAFNAAASPADLEAQAAHLEAHAQYLKNAARQVEHAAQQARANPMMVGEEAAMVPPAFPYSPELSGYGVAPGGPALIPDPSWATASGPTMAAAPAPAKARAKRSPSSADSKAIAAATANKTEKTTIMLRNIPNNYTREMVLDLLDNEGFKTKYDFVYLPMDFHRMAGLGYAFINLVDTEAAEKVKEHFEGFTRWTLASQKVCNVSWGEPLQGLDAHIERYRNSPVMHEDVPDKYKPVLLSDGKRIDFPPPTKRIRPPRVKRTGTGGKNADGDGADGEPDDP